MRMSETPNPNVAERNNALLRTSIQQRVYEAMQKRFATEVPYNRDQAIGMWAPVILRHATRLFRTAVDIESGEHYEFQNPVDRATVFAGSLIRGRLMRGEAASSDDFARCNALFSEAEYLLDQAGLGDSQECKDMQQLSRGAGLVYDIHILLRGELGQK